MTLNLPAGTSFSLSDGEEFACGDSGEIRFNANAAPQSPAVHLAAAEPDEAENRRRATAPFVFTPRPAIELPAMRWTTPTEAWLRDPLKHALPPALQKRFRVALAECAERRNELDGLRHGTAAREQRRARAIGSLESNLDAAVLREVLTDPSLAELSPSAARQVSSAVCRAISIHAAEKMDPVLAEVLKSWEAARPGLEAKAAALDQKVAESLALVGLTLTQGPAATAVAHAGARLERICADWRASVDKAHPALDQIARPEILAQIVD